MTKDMAFLFGLALNWLYCSCCFAFDGIPLGNVQQDKTDLQILDVSYNDNQQRSEYHFPDTIQLQLTQGELNITMSLLRNTRMDAHIPISIERQRKIIYQYINQTDIVLFYQDQASVASFMVSTEASPDVTPSDFKYFGTFYSGNDSYLLQQYDVHRGRYTLSKIERKLFGDDTIDRVHVSDLDAYERSLPNTGEHRQKRSNKQMNEVEVLAVVDYSVYEFWYKQTKASTFVERDVDAKRNIRQYYAFVMNAVDIRYQSITDRNYEIRILLSGVHIADTRESSPWTEQIKRVNTNPIQVNASEVLNSFQQWCIKMKNKIIAHDDALLFTKYDLTSLNYGKISSNTIGIGYNERVCTDSGQSVIEDDFTAYVAETAAHEMGHNLGAEHDDLKENECLGEDNYIMTAIQKSPHELPDNIVRREWMFSKCSADFFGNYIDKLNRQGNNCMSKRSSNDNILEEYGGQLPGQIYSPDMQCKNKFGDKSYLTKGTYNGDFASICMRMNCHVPDKSGYSYSILAWEGTFCGVEKMCRSGHCVTQNVPTTQSPTTDGCVDKSPALCAQMNSSMCQKGPIATFCCKTCQTLQESVCITSCDGLADNDYQSCTGCSVYATCVSNYVYDNRPCPWGLVWTDDTKGCDYSSKTCIEKKNLVT